MSSQYVPWLVPPSYHKYLSSPFLRNYVKDKWLYVIWQILNFRLFITFNFAIIQIFSAFVWCILRLDKMERVVQWAYTLHLESENCQRSARIRDPTSWLVSLWPSGRNWAKDWSKSGLRGCPLISGSKWALG